MASEYCLMKLMEIFREGCLQGDFFLRKGLLECQLPGVKSGTGKIICSVR